MIRAPYHYHLSACGLVPLKTLTKGGFRGVRLDPPKKSLQSSGRFAGISHEPVVIIARIHCDLVFILSRPWLAAHNKHLPVDLLLPTVETVMKKSKKYEMPTLESCKVMRIERTK